VNRSRTIQDLSVPDGSDEDEDEAEEDDENPAPDKYVSFREMSSGDF